MHFVTLTSDWNNEDFYTGAVKGKLLSSIDNVEIIEISNKIKPYSITEAAFIIRNSFLHFPKNTIHIIAVGSDPAPNSKLLAAKIEEHFFLTADNGLLSLLGDALASVIVEIKPADTKLPTSFRTLSVFCDTAIQILKGKELEEIGTPIDDYIKQIPLRATLENNTITGTVIYIDSFGNAITNISLELFERIGKGRPFEIFVQSKHYKITKLNSFYSETEPGDLLALFNSINLLEIALRNGSVKELLNINTDSTIRVEFK